MGVQLDGCLTFWRSGGDRMKRPHLWLSCSEAEWRPHLTTTPSMGLTTVCASYEKHRDGDFLHMSAT